MSPMRSFTRSISSGGGGGSGTVTNIATTSPISGGPITTTGTLSLLVNVDFAWTAGQTITAPAGQTALTLTGGTQTSSFPVLAATQTWNAAGTTFTGLRLNVTNTASAVLSMVLDVQLGGSSLLAVGRYNATLNGLWIGGVTPSTTNYALLLNTTTLQVNAPATGSIGFSIGDGSNVMSLSSTLVNINQNVRMQTAQMSFNVGNDAALIGGGANILDLRNQTSAQIFNVYNTYTSATTFERLMVDWATTANVAMIYTQKGSVGGTARVLQLNYGGTTTSAISIPITSGTITFGGALTTTGASAIIASGTAIPAGGTAGTGYRFSSTANYGVFFGSGAPTLTAAQGSLYLRSDGNSTSTRAYINTDGAGTWTAITTAA